MSRIAAEIRDRFHNTPPQVPALLLPDHGVNIWASSPAAARHYLELVDYIFRYRVAARRTGIDLETGDWGNLDGKARARPIEQTL